MKAKPKKPRTPGAAVPGRRTAAAEALLRRVGERVRNIREQRAMTRQNLATAADVSVAYVGRMEAGKGNVSLQLLQQLALALGVSMEDLVRDDSAANLDVTLIAEFLRRQPPASLARIRAQLMETYGYTKQARNRHIALLGLRGAGKSTLGQRLADALQRPFIEMDREIEKDAGLALSEIFLSYGQADFRRLERRCLERIVSSSGASVIAASGGIVTEPGTFSFLLASCFTVWLKTHPEEYFRRVTAQRDERITAPDLKKEAMDNIRRSLEARDHFYMRADVTLDTTGKSVEQALQELLGSVSREIAHAGGPAASAALP